MEKTGFFPEGTASSNEKLRSHRRIVLRLLAMLIFICTGCSSGFVTLSPRVPEKYEMLGPAKGKACGLIVVDTPFVCWGLCTFMPVTLNGRLASAYQKALDSVPGATSLINVTLQEDQYWWVVGDAKCVTITGVGIR